MKKVFVANITPHHPISPSPYLPVPHHQTISHKRLRTEGPIQWPCPDNGKLKPGEPARLYTDLRFHTPDGRARFAAYHSRGLAEPPDQQYPFVLTNGRLYGHWQAQTRTGRIEKIRQLHPHPFIEIHPHDAGHLGIQESDWVEVRSRRGKAQFPAKVTRAIVPGTVFVPMHWGAMQGNAFGSQRPHPFRSLPRFATT